MSTPDCPPPEDQANDCSKMLQKWDLSLLSPAQREILAQVIKAYVEKYPTSFEDTVDVPNMLSAPEQYLKLTKGLSAQEILEMYLGVEG